MCTLCFSFHYCKKHFLIIEHTPWQLTSLWEVLSVEESVCLSYHPLEMAQWRTAYGCILELSLLQNIVYNNISCGFYWL